MLGQPSPPVQVRLTVLGMGDDLPVFQLRVIKTVWDDTSQSESKGSVNECHQHCPIEGALGSRKLQATLEKGRYVPHLYCLLCSPH